MKQNNPLYLVHFFGATLSNNKALYSFIVISFMFLNGCMMSPVTYEETVSDKLLVGATIHFANGEIMNDATIAISDGRISYLDTVRLSAKEASNYRIDQLGKDYHIYPFIEEVAGNSGIVLARADAEPINISVLKDKDVKSIVVGEKAQFLICLGNIEDAKKFSVEYVIMGDEKVKVLQQSDYGVKSY